MSDAAGGAVRAAISAGDLIRLPMAKLAADVATTTARAIPRVLPRTLPMGPTGPLMAVPPPSPALTSTLTVAPSLCVGFCRRLLAAWRPQAKLALPALNAG